MLSTSYEQPIYNTVHTYSPTAWIFLDCQNQHDDVSSHHEKRNQGELLGRSEMEKQIQFPAIVLKPSLPFPLVRTVRNQNLEKPGLNRSSLVTWVDGSLYHIYLTLYTFEIVNFETYLFAFSTLQQKLVRSLLFQGIYSITSHMKASALVQMDFRFLRGQEPFLAGGA